MKVQFNGMSNYKLDLFKEKIIRDFGSLRNAISKPIIIRMQKHSG